MSEHRPTIDGIDHRPTLKVEDIKRAIGAAKLAVEQDRKRWCRPATVYHRGKRCYVFKLTKNRPLSYSTLTGIREGHE